MQIPAKETFIFLVLSIGLGVSCALISALLPLFLNFFLFMAFMWSLFALTDKLKFLDGALSSIERSSAAKLLYIFPVFSVPFTHFAVGTPDIKQIGSVYVIASVITPIVRMVWVFRRD